MPKGLLQEEDLLSLIERTRAWLDARAAESGREPVVRRSERRGSERRALGVAARREEDAQLNRQRRGFLLAYFRRLDVDQLLEWIDRFWLAQASDVHLAALVKASLESAKVDVLNVQPGRDRTGPPARKPLPVVPQVHDESMRAEWSALTKELKSLSHARRQHRAHMKRGRSGDARSVDVRKACLESPVGGRVERAGLFKEFFDEADLIPSEMAASLLRQELHEQLAAIERDMRAQASTALSEVRQEFLATQAAKAAALRETLPDWRTMHRRLRQKS